MKVTLTRSGGFAGMSTQSSVDTAELPPDQAAKLTALVERLPDAVRPHGKALVADGFQYDLTIEDGRATRHVRLTDGNLAPDAQALIDWLHAR
jgi:hypothetical protein